MQYEAFAHLLAGRGKQAYDNAASAVPLASARQCRSASAARLAVISIIVSTHTADRTLPSEVEGTGLEVYCDGVHVTRESKLSGDTFFPMRIYSFYDGTAEHAQVTLALRHD